MRPRAPSTLIFAPTESRSGLAGERPMRHLQLVEDQAVPDLLRLPDVGVEATIDLGRVGQHRHQLEHVAVDLELDARHVVEDVAEPLGRTPRGRGPCSRRWRGRSAGGPRPASRHAPRGGPRADGGESPASFYCRSRDVFAARRPSDGYADRSRGHRGGGARLRDDLARRQRRQRRAAHDRRGPRRLARPAAVDQQRLPRLAGLADPARRLARRPARPPQDVRRRHHLVRARQPAVRARAQRRDPDRGPDPAGRRAARC